MKSWVMRSSKECCSADWCSAYRRSARPTPAPRDSRGVLAIYTDLAKALCRAWSTIRPRDTAIERVIGDPPSRSVGGIFWPVRGWETSPLDLTMTTNVTAKEPEIFTILRSRPREESRHPVVVGLAVFFKRMGSCLVHLAHSKRMRENLGR